MLRHIIYIREDGRRAMRGTILFEVPNKDFDLCAAVSAAATDYAKTPDGLELYENNSRELNWADFDVHVPNEFCEKYGFRKVKGNVLPNIEVNWDEDLVDESKIYDEDYESEEK